VGRRLISSGSEFEAIAGYSRAIVDEPWIFVAGTTGFDYATHTIADDIIAQAEQCFRNISAALAEAGSSLEDVVRVRYYLADGVGLADVGPVFGRHFAAIRPAATAITCGFVDPRIKIEIEVTAKRRE